MHFGILGPLIVTADGGEVPITAGRDRVVLAVLPGDPVGTGGASHLVVLPSRTALIAWAAERAFASLTGFVEEVHAATGYGRIPMWNLIGDTVLGPCASAAALAGGSAADGHAVGTGLLDALVALGAPITRRGLLCSIASDGTPTVRRGACCLYYRQSAGETCETCPLPRPR